MAIGTSYCIGLWGLKAYIIQVQAFTSNGLPYFSIIGLPDTSLGEARERVKSACTVTGFSWPQTRVTVNLSPASLPKSGSSFDLAIAASILASSRAIDPSCLADSLLIGELNLDGSIMPVRGILPMLLFAKKSGLRTVYLPEANLAEARLVEGMNLIGLSHLSQFIANCHPNAELSATMGKRFGNLILKAPVAASQEWERILPFKQRSFPPDFSDSSDALNEDLQVLDFTQVIGQEQAKEALVVAAAGGHHLIMTGPPGAGKTMLAKRLPTILPPLDPQERIEVASIKSLCGTLQANSMDFLPPFEAPHHTASVPSLIGGGNGFAHPGAITRAHHGVLFMDEAPEFSTACIQALREPLENGVISLSRSMGTTFYPARFQLVMAANPCPCGFNWGNGERCTCTPRQRQKYWGRLSGPIMDRIDLHIPVGSPSMITAETTRRLLEKDSQAVADDRYSSSRMRDRVIEARNHASRRFDAFPWSTNAQAPGGWLREATPVLCLRMVNSALHKQDLSMRGADRVLRLAWTLSDLAGRNKPTEEDILQAMDLRLGGIDG